MGPISPNEESVGHYFALPRLVQKWQGGSAIRSEGNWLEAYVVGVAVYLISYFLATKLLLTGIPWWWAIIGWSILLFVMWAFWLIVLYLNSLLVKLVRTFGLSGNLSRKRVQSILIGILTTAFSAELMTGESWLRWVGALWMIGVAVNLTSALLLALLHDECS